MRDNIPWKLTTSIDDTSNLLQNMGFPYTVDTYICSCGHNEFIVKGKEQPIEYVCEECGNDLFYDANYYIQNIAWSYFQEVTRQTPEENPKLLFDAYPIQSFLLDFESSIQFRYGYNIPTSIDLMTEHIHFENKAVYTLGFEDGKFNEYTIAPISQELIDLAKTSLHKYLLEQQII